VKFIALILCLTFSAVANPTFRILKEVQISDGKAFLTVSERIHVLGQPFHIEVRAQCRGQLGSAVETLPVIDSMTVCDLDPNSVKINSESTAVAVKTKMANIEAHYAQFEAGREPDPRRIPCESQTEIVTFSLQNLCNSVESNL